MYDNCSVTSRNALRLRLCYRWKFRAFLDDLLNESLSISPKYDLSSYKCFLLSFLPFPPTLSGLSTLGSMSCWWHFLFVKSTGWREENRFSQCHTWSGWRQKVHFINKQRSVTIRFYRTDTKIRRENYLCDVQQVGRRFFFLFHFAMSENSLRPWHWKKIERETETPMQVDYFAHVAMQSRRQRPDAEAH